MANRPRWYPRPSQAEWIANFAAHQGRLFDWLSEQILSRLQDLEGKMDAMSQDQSHLDAEVSEMAAYLTNIENEVANLKAQPAAQALDFSQLDALVARAKGDDPTVAPTPVDSGSDAGAPVDSGASDGASTDGGDASAPVDASAPTDDSGASPSA